MQYCFILGTRPEIIKLSPLFRVAQARGLDYCIIHTNQHYSEEMDALFFRELNLQPPEYNLHIGSGPHGQQTGKMIIEIEKILLAVKPKHLIVQGDTNSVVAGALGAAKELSINISHVEAGLRSYDRTMPEEINRVIADHISDFLFVPTETEQQIVLREGIPMEKVHIVGNTIVDAVVQNIKLAKILSGIEQKYGVQPYNYFLLTLHRPSNVDTKETFQVLIDGLVAVGKKYHTPILFPCHPRTMKSIEEFNMVIDPSVITIIPPIGYLEMLYLMDAAKLIFTDSGGIQEEACILKTKCITLRHNTERPSTLEVGGNILAGNTYDKILSATHAMQQRQVEWSNPFGDGNTAVKIMDILQSHKP